MPQGARRTVVAVLGIVLVASGCTTTARVWTGDTSAAAVLPQVERGDRVLLVLAGPDLHCPITGFDAEFVYGCKGPVALRDIQEVRFRRMDGEATLTLRDLRPKDWATVTMRSGQVSRFRITAIESGTLRGEGVEVVLSDVDRMTITRNPPSPGARAVLIGLGTAVVAVGVAIMYMIGKGSEGSD
jgi:hypothetical protein